MSSADDSVILVDSEESRRTRSDEEVWAKSPPEGQNKKRRRVERAVDGGTATDVHQRKKGENWQKLLVAFLEKLAQEIEDLDRKVSENRNTKREIQEVRNSLMTEAARIRKGDIRTALQNITDVCPEPPVECGNAERGDRDMASQTNQDGCSLEENRLKHEVESLERTVKDLEDGKNKALEREVENLKVEVELWKTRAREAKEQMESQKSDGEGFSGTTKDAGTQTAEAEAPADYILGRIRTCGSEEEALALARQRWPEEIYNVTSLTIGDFLEREGDLALYTREGDMARGVGRRLGDRFPELKMIGGVAGEVVIGSITQTNKIRKAEGEATSSRTIYKLIPPPESEDCVESKFFKCMKKLDECMVRDGVLNISLAVPDGIEVWRARRLAELAAVGSDRRYDFVAKRKQGDKTQPQKSKGRQEGAVIIKAGGRAYAELLKEVKAGVKDRGRELDATSVRRTARGDILLRVPGGEEGAKKARATIMEATKNKVELLSRGDRKLLLVYGVDGSVTKEEAEEELRLQLAADRPVELRITSMRRAQGDSQNLTLETDSDTANTVIEKGSVKIGWTWCKVRERVDLERCYRCHEFGHIRGSCKGPDRGNKCMKCGGEGHTAKDCNSGDKVVCFSCGVEGHRNSSMQCPVYARLIRNARDRLRRRSAGKTKW